jgi:putative chitinase
VQLTGRGRYTEAAADTGLDLVNHPEIASQPAEAAQLLVWYIGKRRSRIRQHLAADTKNYLEARAVVNGKNSDGTVNGLAHFTDAYDAAAALVSAKIATAKASEAAKKASAGPASPAVSLGAKP